MKNFNNKCRFAVYYSGETPKINGLMFNDELNLCDAEARVKHSMRSGIH